MFGSLWRRELETYKDLVVGCAPGTHLGALQLIVKHVAAREGVLDCGAREGSLLARLRDSGFEDLNAIDLDVSLMKLPQVPVRRIDLNGPFAKHYKRKFKLIVCTDVIEHLDSPRDFFRQAHELLDDDGHLCVSLPNIAHWIGRIKFLVKGEHWGFGERNYRHQRHISPMTYDAMRLTMAECGLRLIDSVTTGSFAGPLQKIVLSPIAGAFRLIGGPTALGETAVYLAAKSDPEEQLTKPEHYYSWELEQTPVEPPDGGRLAEVLAGPPLNQHGSSDA
jgi:SAM-dependent methyltransferase